MALINFALSLILGFLSGLGIGGGSLMMTWLTLGRHMNFPRAKAINLMYFLPSAFASVFNRKSVKSVIPKLYPGIATGTLIAWAMGFWSSSWNKSFLAAIYSVFTIYMGIRELNYRPAKPR